MADTTAEDAKKARERKLEALTLVVEICTCLWPLRIYRNGHGHDPNCPVAHAMKVL